MICLAVSYVPPGAVTARVVVLNATRCCSEARVLLVQKIYEISWNCCLGNQLVKIELG